MTEERFWQLIEQSKALAPQHLAQQTMRLRELLCALPSNELLEFIRIFQEKLWLAYRWDLLAVAYLAYYGCSDGNFEEFRAWLISRGRTDFENALTSYEYAARLVKDYAPEEGIGAAPEDFYMLPCEAYRKTFGSDPGDQLPEDVFAYGDREPSGPIWAEDNVCEQFPGLCALLCREHHVGINPSSIS